MLTSEPWMCRPRSNTRLISRDLILSSHSLASSSLLSLSHSLDNLNQDSLSLDSNHHSLSHSLDSLSLVSSLLNHSQDNLSKANLGSSHHSQVSNNLHNLSPDLPHLQPTPTTSQAHDPVLPVLSLLSQMPNLDQDLPLLNQSLVQSRPQSQRSQRSQSPSPMRVKNLMSSLMNLLSQTKLLSLMKLPSPTKRHNQLKLKQRLALRKLLMPSQ